MRILEKSIKENTIIFVPETEENSIVTIARLIAKSFNYENKIIFHTKFSDGQYKNQYLQKITSLLV